jgi:N-methylhydantoinase B
VAAASRPTSATRAARRLEVIERQAPLRIAARRPCVPARAVTGVHRGGDGVVREYLLLEGSGEVMYRGERHNDAGAGRGGWLAGCQRTGELSFGAVALLAVEVVELPAKVRIAWAAGDVLRIETAGGGGWGLPERRRGRRRPHPTVSLKDAV